MTPAFGPPTISAARFAALLAGSPVLAENPAAAYHQIIVNYGLDPAFMLAIFKHESTFARNPAAVVNRYGTKNWGNTRSCSLGSDVWETPPVIQTDRGPFVKFPGWLMGLHDACNRLRAPHYPYAKAGARTVEAIIPIWAPAGDRDNSPSRYIATVVADMRAWADLAPAAGRPIADRQQFLDEDAPNWGHRLMWGGGPDGITIHETGNLAPGATAAMHADFVQNGGGEHGVSFHAVVDEHESIQLMPWNWVAWHGGDGSNGPCNNDRIAIETVQIGSFPKTIDKLVTLVANLMEAHGIPIEDVDQHFDCSGKNCPQFLRSGARGVSWGQFLGKLAFEIARRRIQPRLASPFIAYWETVWR